MIRLNGSKMRERLEQILSEAEAASHRVSPNLKLNEDKGNQVGTPTGFSKRGY